MSPFLQVHTAAHVAHTPKKPNGSCVLAMATIITKHDKAAVNASALPVLVGKCLSPSAPNTMQTTSSVSLASNHGVAKG